MSGVSAVRSRAEVRPLMSVPTFLAAAGDPRDPWIQSGRPFYLLDAGVKKTLLDGALSTVTNDRPYRMRRAAWTLQQLIRGGRPGGFAVSESGVNTMWRKVDLAGECRIINCFQLYPPRVVRDPRVTRWYFLDQTLTQLFEGYNYRVPDNTMERARELEQYGYSTAEGIIASSQWARRSIVEVYGVPAERVHVVLIGANLDASALEEWADEQGPQSVSSDRPLRLVFVGREWKRKGLDRLLHGVSGARRAGCTVELGVIGLNARDVPRDLRRIEGVTWHGPLDKRRNQRRFMDLVGSHDVGCLLSRREAAGLGLHEYQALGLAVLGTTAGGAPEQVPPSAGVLLPPMASPEAITETILMLDSDRDRLSRMKAYSWEHHDEVLWASRIDRILDFWPSTNLAPK